MSEASHVGQIVFPVLALSRDLSIERIQNMSEFESCSYAALSGGYYTDLVVLDSAGFRYIIAGAKTGKRSMLAAIFNIRVQVQMEVFSSERVTLDEAKSMVCKQIASDADFWAAGEEVEELLGRVNDAKNLSELLRIFAF